MGVILTVCAAFGLTVSEAKSEIICLRSRGVSDATATFRVEATGQVYKQKHDFVYLGGPRRPVHRDRTAHLKRLVQLLEVFPRTVRPTERPPRVQDPDAESRSTRDNAVRLCHMKPVRHYDTLSRARQTFLIRCIR